MKVAGGTLEEDFADARQHWIAEVTMQWRHRSGLDAAHESVAHYEVVIVAQLFQEWPKVGEIIAVIRVTHDYVFPARRGDAAHQRIPVSFPFHLDHPGSQTLRDLL